MKLRVLQIVHCLHRAGVERLVFDLAVANRSGLETAVVCLDDEGPLADELRQNGFEVYCTHRRPGIDVRQVFRIAKIIRNFNPHVLHCHQYTPFFYGALARIWARALGTKILFTEHGRSFPDPIRYKRRLANHVLSTLAHRITAVCEFTRKRMIAIDGFPADKIEIVYNGVDPNAAAPVANRLEMRNTLGVSPDAFLIVQVATFRSVKDQQTALRAFYIIRQTYPHAVLAFVGEGPDLYACQRLAAYLGVESGVRFLGRRSDVPTILAAADLALMTSLSEAHSVAIMEAMATRLPIVATNVGGIPETIIDRESGLLVDPQSPTQLAAAVCNLIDDPRLRHSLGQAAYWRVLQHFQRSAMHQQYLDIYHQLATGKRLREPLVRPKVPATIHS